MSPDADLNVVSHFRNAVDRVPDRAALIIDRGRGRTERESFAELWTRADRISTGLARRGLNPGERAVLMIPVSIELYAVLLGVLKMGAVAVFVNPWLGREHIGAIADLASPHAYLGSAAGHILRFRNARLRGIPMAVTTGGRLWRVPAPLSLSEIESGNGDGSIRPVASTDPALISFTSGSSGVPKGANRTHDILTVQHEALRTEFPLVDDDVDMTAFPITVLNNLASGITSVVPNISFRGPARIDPGETLALMHTHGVTTAAASPPIIDRIVQNLASYPQIRRTLRRVLSGGAPVFDRQLMTWQDALPDTEIVVAYGSTEAEPVSHITAAERLRARSDIRPGSPGLCTGRPAQNVRTKLIRIHDGPFTIEGGDWSPWEVPQGEIGELLVSGAHVCRDYYKNDEATRETKIAEPGATVWHRMGDTGYFDSHGRFWLVGRVHSTIHRGGEAVHPQLVEQAARGSDPSIRHAAAVGVPDPGLGERVVLVLEADGTSELRTEIERRLVEADQKVDEIIFTDEPLPLDPRHQAKVDYPKLRERLARRPGQSPGGH